MNNATSLPAYAILDVGHIWTMFQQHVKQFDKPASLPEDILQELLECMGERFIAETKLGDAINAMADKSFEYDYDRGISYNYQYYVDEVVIGFVLGLATVILKQLDTLGAYNSVGELVYAYQPMQEGFERIVLRRIDVPAYTTADDHRLARWAY